MIALNLSLVSDSVPVITKVMDVVSDFFQYLSDHKGFVLGLFGAISAALGIIAIKSVIATAPFWLMVAAIAAVGAAIGLLIDDFLTFQEGGDSVIGWVAERFADMFLWLFEMGDKIGNFFGSIWDKMLAGAIAAVNWVLEAYNKVAKYVPGLKEAELISTGKDVMKETSTPLNTMSNTNISNGGNNSVKIDTVNVQTQATDATGIAQGVGGALSNEFEDVLFQNTGGAVA